MRAVGIVEKNDWLPAFHGFDYGKTLVLRKRLQINIRDPQNLPLKANYQVLGPAADTFVSIPKEAPHSLRPR